MREKSLYDRLSYVDTHAHIADEAFEGELHELVARAKAQSVDYIITSGYNLSSSIEAVKAAEKFDYTQEEISKIVYDNFKLTPKQIIETLDLRKPIYRKTSAYGHFGRTDIECTWERIV